jgi:hypothetical protein
MRSNVNKELAIFEGLISDMKKHPELIGDTLKLAAFSTPDDLCEQADTIEAWLKYFAEALSRVCVTHIKDHSGEECVSKMLETAKEIFDERVREKIAFYCRDNDLKNPIRRIPHNELVMKEILAELDVK